MTVPSDTHRSSGRSGTAGEGRSGRQIDFHLRRHLQFGWWSLLVFLTLGIVLEGLHGLKISWYLAPTAEPRRLMWTLAHTHGTLIGLMHLAFASALHLQPGLASRSIAVISNSLIAASILMPGGFFVGGIFIYAGDPGLGILLVPLGGVFLFLAVFLIACNMSGRAASASDTARSPKHGSRRDKASR